MYKYGRRQRQISAHNITQCVCSMASSPHDHEDAAEVARLPLETRCPPYPLRQYGGFWMPEPLLQGMMAARARFEPRPSDVFLASFPKSGTTWLKALAFATLNRAGHPPRHPEHPLRRRNPHDCVKFLEMMRHGGEDDPFAAAPPSPRLISTHTPYPLLPAPVTAEAGSGCRIVYVCRDPKDAFVSTWLFIRNNMAAPAFTVQEAFELSCNGRCSYGPQWRHVVGYWEESRRRPGKVLFLRYEEMLRDPARHVRKLAEFMGCAFSDEEAAAGVVEEIVELCSLDVLKNMEGNRNGTQSHFKNESYFRKGVAGDWSSHMTPAMAARLDKIVDDALRGSGFTFAVTNPT